MSGQTPSTRFALTLSHRKPPLPALGRAAEHGSFRLCWREVTPATSPSEDDINSQELTEDRLVTAAHSTTEKITKTVICFRLRPPSQGIIRGEYKSEGDDGEAPRLLSLLTCHCNPQGAGRRLYLDFGLKVTLDERLLAFL